MRAKYRKLSWRAANTPSFPLPELYFVLNCILSEKSPICNSNAVYASPLTSLGAVVLQDGRGFPGALMLELEAPAAYRESDPSLHPALASGVQAGTWAVTGRS